jgi:hypothetical protein
MGLRPCYAHGDISGTTIVDGVQMRKGYALNKMCYAFNAAKNRAACVADEDAYCRKYGMDDAQRKAIKDREVGPGATAPRTLCASRRIFWRSWPRWCPGRG